MLSKTFFKIYIFFRWVHRCQPTFSYLPVFGKTNLSFLFREAYFCVTNYGLPFNSKITVFFMKGSDLLSLFCVKVLYTNGLLQSLIIPEFCFLEVGCYPCSVQLMRTPYNPPDEFFNFDLTPCFGHGGENGRNE